jgi:translation initiation factor IF-2
MRIHNLAKELGVPSARLITLLQANGFDVKGPLNTIGKEEVDVAKQHMDELKSDPSAKKVGVGKPVGTKKKVFIRSKTVEDPRARRPATGGPAQQVIRPTQIKPKRPGMPVASKPRPKPEPVRVMKPAVVEKPKVEVKPQVVETPHVEAKPIEVKKIAEPVAVVDKSVRQKEQRDQREPREPRPAEAKTTEAPRKHTGPPDRRGKPYRPTERPKFSKEEAIRAAREKRQFTGPRKPASQGQPVGVQDRDADKGGPTPADYRRKKKKPKGEVPRGGADVARKPRKDVVLEGEALSVGLTKLKQGIKTSVDVDRAGRVPKRRKKIVQEKKRFKAPSKLVKRKDSTEYGGRGALVRKHRRRRPDEVQDLANVSLTVDATRKIRITDHMTIKDICAVTGVKSSTIVKFLLDEMNVMATINQVIDKDMVALILENLGIEHEIAVKPVEDILKHEDDDEKDLVRKPPVVTVLGHVDHGKTRLLDTIRRTNVAGGEAGGITQAIGAYQVKLEGRAITFIDTPGHEAFTAMRARGAKVTDVAILVVACDDGVQPQTIEAIDHAKSAGLEIVVALNKIDLESSNPDRVKAQLAELGLNPIEWGGKTEMVPISAKFGQGIDDLLEIVLLQADILDLKANPKAMAEGTIIEAKIDKGKGPLATVLIQRGTLKEGDYVVVGCSYGRIRAMLNENGKKVKTAGPATPAEIYGLSDVPQAGDILNQVANEKTAKEIYEKRCLDKRQESLRAVNKISLEEFSQMIQEGAPKDLNLIIKTDMQGSIEAIIHALGKIINPEVKIQFVRSSVGNVKESDIMLAMASKCIILAFNVVVSPEMKKLASMEGIDVREYNIIYKAVEDIELAMKGMLEPEFSEKVIGTAEIRAIFKKAKGSVIAGMIVTNGKITRGKDTRIMHGTEKIWQGKLESLKRFQEDTREVDTGLECGISISGLTDLMEGDVLEQYEMVEVPRS